MSLSKNHLKLITSLSQKKYRHKYKLFIVEGIKVVQEFLNSSYELEILFSTESSFSYLDSFIEVSEQELKKISSLKTPNKVIALFKIPVQKNSSSSGLIVALDAINDPGNLGTIIRLCDWFGIDQLLCSKETVDCYNTKVVQSSMGSLTRVAISYVDLKEYLTSVSIPVFIADMDGDNIYEMKPPTSAVLVMGNEANGISNSIKQIVSTKISIPRYGNSQLTESLNVATATAILLSEFRR
ncbi:RNA methyltransferase [Flavobacteriaceae bacterium]|jgi:TrmH family RNA methyltransferase|nr:RNA methyltransferase [Flavobacteriaceae bacterium]MDB9927911.1 RNA methyltransferase [Flavobacteriaceae bacterium]MDB9955893.1 RNA methyltransferase [Flavobacteriaceae bacterium]MDC1343774.1 RNA methyltransferase [Flavobacteriaceae bacterium]|tara:strand:+ start:1914 stop:2633 length:720 start_codon:yes stop_codon:yes gene_type:complete